MRFDDRGRLLFAVVVVAHSLTLGAAVFSGQTQPASVPWDTLKARGLELQQNLRLGNYHLAVQDLAHMQLALAGSPKASEAAARTDAMGKHAPTAGELEPLLTAPLVPLADKLVQSIDENDATGVREQILRLLTKTSAIFMEINRRDKAEFKGTQLGDYFDLGEQLKRALHANDVAKSVDVALQLQSMMDGMKARGETGGLLLEDVYLINDALGRAAFLRLDYKAAIEYLMKAVSFPPGTLIGGPICCWGPNLWLAKSLLKAGYRDDVMKFLQTCRRSVWVKDNEKLDQWISELQSGKTPSLQPNANLDF